MSIVPFPVVATRDIRQSASFVRRGTKGEVIGVSRDTPYYYSVAFWPNGPDSGSVRFDYLTRNDLREA